MRNEEVLQKASREINKLTLKDLKLVGSTLYWAEGAKTQKGRLLFVNSDLGMIKIMMRFFREILKIQEEKLQISVQIHPNISKKKAKEFWSKATGIQTNRFQKTLFQISKASKRKRNRNSLPFGTCRININSTINFHRVAGWIQGIAKIN